MSPSRLAYADCFSGVSGDMLLASLVDAGADLQIINAALHGLGLNCMVEVEKENLAGIAAQRVTVKTAGARQSRQLHDILPLLQRGDLSETIRSRAESVFILLAEAEAKVHGCSPDEVHFHEVGAVDTIADVVGVLVALESLGVEKLYSSSLPLARGWVHCEHGELPLPAPAVCELLKDVLVHGVELDAELVTPTGAALLKTLSSGFGPLPGCSIEAIGYGAGSAQRADGRPNLLRMLIATPLARETEEEIEVIETCIDDWHPEGIGYLTERLFAVGALDVFVSSVQMKKNRPGMLLTVLAGPDRAAELKDLILTESTAIGLRFRKERRLVLQRKLGTVQTRWGKVEAKLAHHPDGPRLHPEYESCRRIAIARGVPLQEVYDAVAGVSPEDFEEKR